MAQYSNTPSLRAADEDEKRLGVAPREAMVILYVTYVVCYIRHMQSCRFAFAVHVLAVLATESKCASSASLAATVNTNPVVIRRLLIDLQNAGLIRTSRGPQGGAILAKPPKNISLWHVHSAVESRELFGQHPNPPSPHCPVGQGIEKVLGYVEKRANRSFSRELQMMSLADVVSRLSVRSLESSGKWI